MSRGRNFAMMEVRRFCYDCIGVTDRLSLSALFGLVWGDGSIDGIHSKDMNTVSFCIVDDNEIIAYLGVVSWTIAVRGETFAMCGLSAVCTHPDYRRRGIGTLLVKEATRWIGECGQFDIGLFTCSRHNTHFYENVGIWQRCPELVLREGDRNGAYRSDVLQLDVFKLLISEKAQFYSDFFEHSTITLNFPEGRFI